MEASFWEGKRAPGIEDAIDLGKYRNLADLINTSVRRFSDRPAYTCMNQTLSYAEINELSNGFAAYLQKHTSLEPGDRIAIQLPNILQYPIVVYGAIKAGLVIVNTNPLYTAREMLHQFNDSGVKLLVCLNTVGHIVEEILPETGLEQVIVTELGDSLPWMKRLLVNFAVRHVRKMVPKYSLPEAVAFNDVMMKGMIADYCPVSESQQDDLALLQYTGGTTGVAKGVMLTQKNIIANVLQASALRHQVDQKGRLISDLRGDIVVAPLPLYHVYAFTVHLFSFFELGAHSILIPNPRDLDSLISALQPWQINTFIGLNTLFAGLLNHPEFHRLDFSGLTVTNSGGTALQESVARQWHEVTGCRISEGYGLTEAAPIVAANPAGELTQLGTVGPALSSTSIKIVTDDGEEANTGEAGELCVKGPQIMKGYWNRPEATAEVLDTEGWLHTGDIAVIQEDGYIRIVDRIKDLVIVSGFNVYPNEIENVVGLHEKVDQCAVIGVPDEKAGEAIKLFVVTSDKSLTKQAVRDWCSQQLTSYKVPKYIEFREELPMSAVGKVLRKQLRTEEVSSD